MLVYRINLENSPWGDIRLKDTYLTSCTVYSKEQFDAICTKILKNPKKRSPGLLKEELINNYDFKEMQIEQDFHIGRGY